VLFKYLADRLGVPAALVRGAGGAQAHAWVELALEDGAFVVDLETEIGTLAESSSDAAAAIKHSDSASAPSPQRALMASRAADTRGAPAVDATVESWVRPPSVMDRRRTHITLLDTSLSRPSTQQTQGSYGSP
jgi:hypothetical protein